MLKPQDTVAPEHADDTDVSDNGTLHPDERHQRRFQYIRAGGGAILLVNALIGICIYWLFMRRSFEIGTDIADILLGVFIAFSLFSGVIAWILSLAYESRRTAMQETERQVQKLVKEVTARGVAEAELQKAKEVAEAANAAKSRYLVNVSHEIRSPLNSIYGYAQLMERGHDVAPIDAAKVIRRSAEHLTNLVEGLLDISQVESGVLRISNDTVRLGALLDQVANMFRPQAQNKRIEFIYERPANIPEFVRTDQKRVRQILINILSNAIKFTDAGQVTFRVRYRNQMATFEITDTGIGIDRADIKRIFDPFERGANPHVQRQQGVGLGLSITNALIQMLGGEITVKSEPGKGTTFRVRLMLGKVAESVSESAATETIMGYEGHRRSILLVDDDPIQIDMLSNLLKPLNFDIWSALDGDEGLALAAEVKPDLVLLDISMPGKSGWDVARLLREEHGKALQIVMVSADAHEFKRGGDGAAAHDMFLMKPVELTALLDVIAAQLDLRWTGPVDPNSVRQSTFVQEAAFSLPAAARPYLAEIEQKVRIGHVRAIEGEIRALEAAIPEAKQLVAHLLACLDRFDLKGLTAAIRDNR